jgi:hypothetical protein
MESLFYRPENAGNAIGASSAQVGSAYWHRRNQSLPVVVGSPFELGLDVSDL